MALKKKKERHLVQYHFEVVLFSSPCFFRMGWRCGHFESPSINRGLRFAVLADKTQHGSAGVANNLDLPLTNSTLVRPFSVRCFPLSLDHPSLCFRVERRGQKR